MEACCDQPLDIVLFSNQIQQNLVIRLEQILEAFKKEFVNVEDSFFLKHYEILANESEDGQVCCQATILVSGNNYEIKGIGNGPINAFVNALETVGQKSFKLTDYRSHAIKGGSDADSAAYIFLESNEGHGAWGCGVDPSIEIAGVKALVSALNLLE